MKRLADLQTAGQVGTASAPQAVPRHLKKLNPTVAAEQEEELAEEREAQ